jgi:putative Holliday junction resolvase
MALDPGHRRIGVAVSDELGLLATPVAVIERRSRVHDVERIRALVETYQPSEILIGLPLLPSGDMSSQARRSAQLGNVLQAELGVPIRPWNESYSTVEALRRRRSEGRARRRAPYVDAEAAAVILQDYLDRRS